MNDNQPNQEQVFQIPLKMQTEPTFFGVTKSHALAMAPFVVLALCLYFLGDKLHLPAKLQIGLPAVLIGSGYLFFGASLAEEDRSWWEFHRLRQSNRHRQNLFLYTKGGGDRAN